MPQDLLQAVRKLSESAQLGFAEAKHTLAFYLSTGFGGKPSDEEASLKFEQPAAEGGSNGASLGMAYRCVRRRGTGLASSRNGRRHLYLLWQVLRTGPTDR